MSTCKDCLHWDACKNMLEAMGHIVDGDGQNADKRCNDFADKSQFTELPCKIGDTVWCIRNFHGHKHPQEGIVSEMLFTKEMKLQIVVKYVGCGHWGEKIFATREAAEAAINNKKAMYIYTEDDDRTFAAQLASREEYDKGYKAGYKAGCAENQNKSRWIPVTERLPELIPCEKAGTAYSEAVIVWTTGKKAMIAVWDGIDFLCAADYWEAWGETITHWMPLPEPPKEETCE